MRRNGVQIKEAQYRAICVLIDGQSDEEKEEIRIVYNKLKRLVSENGINGIAALTLLGSEIAAGIKT